MNGGCMLNRRCSFEIELTKTNYKSIRNLLTNQEVGTKIFLTVVLSKLSKSDLQTAKGNRYKDWRDNRFINHVSMYGRIAVLSYDKLLVSHLNNQFTLPSIINGRRVFKIKPFEEKAEDAQVILPFYDVYVESPTVYTIYKYGTSTKVTKEDFIERVLSLMPIENNIQYIKKSGLLKFYADQKLISINCPGIIIRFSCYRNGHYLCNIKQMENKETKQDKGKDKPAHYDVGVDVFDVAPYFLTPEELKGFYKGNILRYFFRQGRKANTDDTKKCKDYMEKLDNLSDEELQKEIERQRKELGI